MNLEFSEKPGPRERQLQRKFQNPLFAQQHISQLDVDNARIADQLDTEEFLENFRGLVEQAINLPANIDAEDILKIKANLEQNYTRCMGLGGDMEPIKQGLIKLLEVIMQSLIKGANGDTEAMQRIDKEMELMKLHFQLSESRLFSDFMHEDPIINQDEVIPTLLSASEEDLSAVLHIFNEEQLKTISTEISEILPTLGFNQSSMAYYKAKQNIIDEWLKGLSTTH